MVLTVIAKIRSYCFKVCYDSRKEKMESLFMQKTTQKLEKVIVGSLDSCWIGVAVFFAVGEKWGNHYL